MSIETTVNLAPSMSNSPKIRFSCLLFLLLQRLFSVGVNSSKYEAADNLAINCGAIGILTSDVNGSRSWIGDKYSNDDQFSLIQHGKDSVSASPTEFDSSVPRVPYYTVRLSRSQFTYSLRVKEGQKFIRLHFFPSTYGNFDRSNSFFSVKAGPFTLLKDFNASLTADNDDDPRDFVLREYCINVDQGQMLNITFIPSVSHPDCYAFINGIEVVSIPRNLYYSKPNGKGLNPVGLDGNPFMIKNNTALETVYRINVGGHDISPSTDTGMYRSWYDDSSYLENPHNNSLLFTFGQMNYTLIPDYTAPDDVYRTARSYGQDATSKYNVTWNFKVDPQFTYMVRLHFCEISPNFTEVFQRVFQIFIADMLAEDRADVIYWTTHNLVPIYKDYGVILGKSGSLKLRNLSIKLQPLQTGFSYDVILNGLEIFRISDPQSNNLAGLNHDSLPPTQVTPPKPIQKSNKRRIKTIIATVTSAVSCVTLVFLVACYVNRQGKKVKDTKPGEGSSSIPPYICRHFSIAEIRVATENFNEHFIIGKGGFGNVYKGYIDDATIPVAIKRLKQGSQQGAHEFMTEIEMLSQLVHRNLVSLIGYCNDENEMILVYQFVARGTLRDHLYNTDNLPLPWKLRLQICIGAAHGLYYLHAGARHNIIHRDVKSTNILLDEKWVAKVSDFGLSKIGPTEVSCSHITTAVKGSFGYLDPEYYMRQRLTLKSDVYAFGVVLLEVLCGRPPLLRSVEKLQACLVEWVQKCHSEGKIDQMVDPFLKGIIAPESLNKFSALALDCLLDDGNQRPSMNEVVWGLKFALKLQERAERATSTLINIKGEEKDLKD